MRTSFGLIAATGAVLAVAACFETATLIPGPGSGGAAAGGAAQGGDMPTGGNEGGGASVGGSAQGGNAQGGNAQGGSAQGGSAAGGGGNDCVPEDCPGTDTDCRTRVCNPGCVYDFEAAGNLCDDDGGNVCDGSGACVVCNDSDDCAGVDMVCVNNACVQGALANGDVCADDLQCTSGVCQTDDGICCDAACSGTCESCLGANTCGSDGTCAPVTAGTDPDNECGLDNCFGGACENGTVAFVTSTAFNGNLGGLTGADQICANHATAACLPGTYMAWLSDDVASPSTRFNQQLVPYRTVDGTQIAVNYASLTDNNIDVAFNLDENGDPGPASAPELCMSTDLVHSGTNADGTPLDADQRCGEWMSSSQEGAWGNRTESNNLWSFMCTGTSGGTCSLSAPIYCFQQ